MFTLFAKLEQGLDIVSSPIHKSAISPRQTLLLVWTPSEQLEEQELQVLHVVQYVQTVIKQICKKSGKYHLKLSKNDEP